MIRQNLIQLPNSVDKDTGILLFPGTYVQTWLFNPAFRVWSLLSMEPYDAQT